jgi:hypothetical protein
MSNIRRFAIEPTGVIHLRDASEELMYADGPDGKPDRSKPMEVVVYSPGSKVYARANAKQNNRLIDRMKAKGKTKQSAQELAEEKAEFLTECTKEFRNIDYVTDEGIQLSGESLHRAVYEDLEIGFIADQVSKHLGEWGNFTKALETA